MSIQQMCDSESATAQVARSIAQLSKPVIAAVEGFALGGGFDPWALQVLEISAGRIVEFTAKPALMRSWRFSYRASPLAWSEYWKPMPKPGFHDLLALTKRGEAVLEGELHPFMTHLQYFKDLLALPRLYQSKVAA